MADRTFIVHSDWLNNIANLPIEMQDKIIADVVRYGCRLDMEYIDDHVVQSFVNMLKGAIDYSVEKYEEKMNMSKVAGRKKKVVDNRIYELARQGKNAADIANIIECSVSAVNHSEGWRRRKEDGFKF
jgi:hypothetical protein